MRQLSRLGAVVCIALAAACSSKPTTDDKTAAPPEIPSLVTTPPLDAGASDGAIVDAGVATAPLDAASAVLTDAAVDAQVRIRPDAVLARPPRDASAGFESKPDCSITITNPSSATCRKQFCAKHPDDPRCMME